MRYTPAKTPQLIGGQKFWPVTDTTTGEMIAKFRKKHNAFIHAARKNKLAEKEADNGR